MAKKKKKKIDKRYCIYVQPEDEDRRTSINKCFKKKKDATSFAYIETKAGMGEEYFVKDKKTKKFIA